MEKMDAETAGFGILEKLSTRYGNTLAGTFVPSSTKIALRAFRPITCTSRDEPTEFAGKDPSYIHFIKPEFVFENSILRSLVAESSTTFVALQSLKRRGSKSDYAEISKTYRSIVRACLEKLQNAIGMDADDEENEEEECDSEAYQQYISIFYSIECIWHLFEIFYLQPASAYAVVPQLLDWIRFHFPSDERSATDLLLSGREAGETENYWPTLKGLIMQGHLEITYALLQLHPAAESSAFKMSLQILKAMPTYDVHSGVTIQKFRSQWEYWKIDTERKLAANILATEPNLENIIQLILGDTKAWNDEIANSECWYEYFPGFLFYTNPSCKHFELGTAASDWLIRWAKLKGVNGPNIQLKNLDEVILRLMENDLYQVFHRIQTIGDNKWFATHITDLLYNCGQLRIIGERQVEESLLIRNSLVFEYGSNLMACEALLQIGINYLEHCSVEGKAALEILIPRLPISTEKAQLRILAAARKRGFLNTEKEICKILSKRSLNRKSYGNALEWAVRSKDAIFVTSIADFLLKHYTKTGYMLCPDVLSKLGSKMFISPRLVFLCKYFEFYSFYRMKEFLQAAEVLVVLLESKSTPEYFWPSLLIDSLPLLESKDPKLVSIETCMILANLESHLIPLIERTKKRLEKDPNASVDILKDYRVANIEELVNLIRLACARNLARAIVIEGTLKGL